MNQDNQTRIYDFLESNMDPTKATPVTIANELDIPIDIVIGYMRMWYEQRGVKID